MEKRKIEAVKTENNAEAWNMGEATLKRIDQCFLDFKQFVRMGRLGASLTEIRELLTEVNRMLSPSRKALVDGYVQQINETFTPRPATEKAQDDNQICWHYMHEIEKNIKDELWDRGFTMPKRTEVTEKGGM